MRRRGRKRISLKKVALVLGLILLVFIMGNVAYYFSIFGPEIRLYYSLSKGSADTGGNQQTTIPFYEDSGLIYVPVSINGYAENLTFLVDTGGMSALDEDIFAELSMDSDFMLEGMEETAKVTSFDVLGVGDFELRDITAMVMDLSFFDDLTAVEVDGVLGSNALRFFQVLIDYEDDFMTLSQDVPPDESFSGFVIPFEKEAATVFSPQVEYSVSGSGKQEAIIDTGFRGYLEVPSSLAERYLENKESSVIRSTENGKASYLLRLENLSLGELHIDRVLASSGDARNNGVIGNQFLSKFQVMIDYPKGIVMLSPYSNNISFKTNIFSPGLNLGIDDSGDVVVSGFFEGSPASESGLTVGDKVLEVNGFSTEMMPLEQIIHVVETDMFEKLSIVAETSEGKKEYTIRKEFLFEGGPGSKDVPEDSFSASEPNKTTVLVLGSLYGYHMKNSRFSLQDLFDIMFRYDPDVIAVELPDGKVNASSDVLSEYYPVEMVQVPQVFEQKEIYGIDWLGEFQERELYTNWTKDFGVLRLTEKLAKDENLSTSLAPLGVIVEQQRSLALTSTPEEIYDGRFAELSERFYEMQTEILTGTGYEQISEYDNKRREKIAENAVSVIEENPDKKILVLVGMNHRAHVRDSIREHFGESIVLKEI